MRKISPTTRFRRDIKREIRGPYRRTIEHELPAVLELLANDQPLPLRFQDHSMTGNWHDHRDCHIKPDLVLIYQKSEPGLLTLARIGSHSELEI